MKTLLLVLGILFAALSLAGVLYVLKSEGNANAGYAVVPMLFELICFSGYRALKKK